MTDSRIVALGTPRPGVLADRFGRIARDLRVSLTDRCNLRCTYCMPAEGLDWTPKPELLDDDEVIRLIRIAVTMLGVRQVRFTGGEPLLRRGLECILAATVALRTDLGTAPGTALTTNGLGLDKRAAALREAGLDRVNISLDTLNRLHYAALTRRDRLPAVLRSVDAAAAAGLRPVKLNCVIMPGINDGDIVELARFALDRGAQLRFIEQMPLGPRGRWDRSRMITAADILARLGEAFDMRPAAEPRGSAPAALWRVRDREEPGRAGEIGVIASVTAPFCGDCDRTRLTADGMVRSCLFSREETSLRDAMRAGADDAEVARLWRDTMWSKAAGHAIDDPSFIQPRRPMSAIGG